MAERINVLGQKVDTAEKWDSKGFLVECYNEFLRMVQLNQVSKVSGKKISSLTFNQYMNECRENLKFVLTDIKKELILQRISKQHAEFAEAMARKSKEAIDWYFALSDKEQNAVVYPESAPTEADMKKLVEKQAEEEVIANVPVPGTKGLKGGAKTELKVVKKGTVGISSVKDGLKDSLLSNKSFSSPTLLGPDGNPLTGHS